MARVSGSQRVRRERTGIAAFVVGTGRKRAGSRGPTWIVCSSRRGESSTGSRPSSRRSRPSAAEWTMGPRSTCADVRWPTISERTARRTSAWARGVIWITRLPSCGEANSGAPRHSLKGTTAAISTSRPFVDRGFFTQRAGSRRGSRSIHLNPRFSLQGACWQGSLTSHAVRDLRKRGAR